MFKADDGNQKAVWNLTLNHSSFAERTMKESLRCNGSTPAIEVGGLGSIPSSVYQISALNI